MCNISRKELYQLLDTAKKDLLERQIVIWGVGNTAKLYRENLRKLESEGLNIVYYADGNPSKWGGFFNEKLVISPEKIKELNQVFVLICSMNPKITAEIQADLINLGIEGEPIDRIIFSMHSDEIMKCYDMLEDIESKKVYAALIDARMSATYPEKDVINKDYYSLSQFCRQNEQEIMVECGGYIGDTLENYIRRKKGKFGKIISFEPDPNNVTEMHKRIKRLLEEFRLDEKKIVVYPYAVGDKEEKVVIVRSETNRGNLTQIMSVDKSINYENGDYMEMVTLDDFLKEPYTFLKVDVEGYEKQVLYGAESAIKKNKPLLAFSIYHKAMDFYDIPMLIKEIVPEYKLSIRHCRENTLAATIVYAYI